MLRSLAMGLCDDSSASALFRELPGDYVRHGAKEQQGRIEVDLVYGNHRYRIVTIIRSLKAFERVEQKLYGWRGTEDNKKELRQNEFPWEKIFATGYGAGIRVDGTADFEYYQTVDAVYPLFRYDVRLQNPELVVRRLMDEARKSNHGAENDEGAILNRLKHLLAGLLGFDHDDHIVLTSTGIAVNGPWGTVGFSALGDGYKSIVTMALDMIAWYFLKCQQEGDTTQLMNPSGIVLIDELEQHLHPSWQRTALSRLRSSFPAVQFIATTHSPLVASGSEDVPVHKLNRGEHTVVEPFGWLAEDVYRFMGVESSRAEPFRQVIRQFQELDRSRLKGQLTAEELQKLTELKRRLRSLPCADPIVLSSELMNLADELKATKNQ